MRLVFALLVVGSWRLILTLLFTMAANGASYYVDYATGSDANNGTAKATPWKKAPGMKGFTGAYSHVSGDRIIFKGGVTWPANCYQWKREVGGTAGSIDYYGADPTWYTGASFVRPLFDFERIVINGWVLGAGFYILNSSYITIDNLDFANHWSPLEKNGISTWGCATITLDGAYSITITNSIVRDWGCQNVNGVIEYRTMGGGGIHKVNQGNSTIVHSEMHQLNSGVYSGTALWNVVWVYTNHLHHLAGNIMSANVMRGNLIHDINNPGDGYAHANAALVYSPYEFSGNTVYNTSPVAQVLMYGPGNETYPYLRNNYIFNNRIYSVTQPAIVCDTDGSNDQNVRNYVWNNTLVAEPPIKVAYRANGSLAHFEAINNHLISTGPAIVCNNPSIGGAYVVTLNHANNLTNTPAQAAAAGYTVANQYAPTDAGDPTVGTGTNLTTQVPVDVLGNARSVPWNIGAYHWGGEPLPAGGLAFATDSYSTAEDTSLTVTVARTGGTSGSVTVGYATANVTALAGTDYTATSGTATLGDGVTSATFNVPILRNEDYTGNRYLTVTLSSPTGGAGLVSPSSTTITIADSDSAPSAIPELGLSFPVTDMLMAAPFTVTGGIVSQQIQTLATNDSGKLSAYFTVTTEADYQQQLGVSTPAFDADSFYVTVDGVNDVFDVIPLTVGFEDRWVNLRGSGEYDEPEFQPKVWHLTAGTHFMAIMGREANAGITNVAWVLQSAPPEEFLQQQLAFASSTAWTYQNGVIIQLAVNRVGTNGIVTVDYATSDDSAVAGTNYTATTGTLTFDPEIATKLLSIPVANLTTYVGSKTFTVTLTNPVGAVLSNPQICTVAILDDLNPPALRVMNAGTVNVNIIFPK